MMGEKFGAYKLIRKVAQGGMAEVFLAERPSELGHFSQQVAIKRIYPHLARDPELASMFFDEARIASRLHHPNIAQIFDLGELDEFFYIAMEFVHGYDLRALCELSLDKHHFLPLHLAVRIIADVASGLHYAHSRVDDEGNPMHIVHRDVSPQNVLVGFNGNVKLCDFGIAKASERLTVTRAGQFKGKFSYMSPEQTANGSDGIDARSDIFALGTVLYEITAITRLFRGRTDFETIRMVTEQPIVPPSQIRPDFPKSLEPIVLKALERDLDKRYQTAQDLQLALEEWLISERAMATSAHLSQFMQSLFPEEARREVTSVGPKPQPPAAPAAAPSLSIKAPALSITAPAPVAQAAPTTQALPSLKSLAASLPKPSLSLSPKLTPPAAPLEPPAAPTDPILRTPDAQISEETAPIQGALADASQESEAEDASSHIVQEAMSDEEYDLLDATGEIKLDNVRDLVAQRRFSEQESSHPFANAAQTPLPRERNMTPMGHHEMARESMGAQLATAPLPQAPLPMPAQQPQLEAPRQISGQHPAQTRPPRVSGQHPSIVRVTGPHATIPRQQPKPVESTLDLEREAPNEASASADFIDFGAIQRRDRRKKVIIAVVAIALIAAVGAFFAKYGTERDVPPPEDAKPQFTEEQLKTQPLPALEKTELSLTTEPAGATIIVNGIPQPNLTPGTIKLVTGKTNSVWITHPERLSAYLELNPSDPAPETITLKPLPKLDPKTPKTTIRVETRPEGVQISSAAQALGISPVTIDPVYPGSMTSLVLSKEGLWPNYLLYKPTPEVENAMIVSLDERSLKSKEDEADIVVDILPKGSQIFIDGQLVGVSPTRYTARRNQLLKIEAQHPDHKPMTRYIESAEFGTLSLRDFLTPLSREKGRFSLKLPSGVRRAFIGSSSYTEEQLKRVELIEGEHTVVFTMDDGARVEGTLTVEPQAMINYKAAVNNGKLVFSR